MRFSRGSRRPPTPDMAGLLAEGPAGRPEALTRRIADFLTAAGSTGIGPGGLLRALDETLADGDHQEAWLALAVVGGRLPWHRDVLRLRRSARIGEALPTLYDLVSRQIEEDGWPDVEIISGMVVVDLHHTATHPFSTGIQRVSRELARRWADRDDVVFVGSTPGHECFRRLTDGERRAVLEGAVRPAASTTEGASRPVVPWRCTHVTAELPSEGDRPRRYQAFIELARCRTGFVGHDCVPLTAAETTDVGVPYGFASYLAGLACATRVAVTSDTSDGEYRGWKAMLTGSGRPGPDLRIVRLPVEAAGSAPADLAEARERLHRGGERLVLSVGSHEPRKNHLAVLHAAELLWREGLEFSLVFVGGNSWNSDAFEARVAELQEEKRPVRLVRALPDRLLWAAYRIAWCSVFPSLHEGFGLPVAESLACGTPVVTSRFGSMRELSARGGALLVDPRDDHDIASALRRLLTDTDLRDRLANESAGAPARSWDDYAKEVWRYLVEEET